MKSVAANYFDNVAKKLVIAKAELNRNPESPILKMRVNLLESRMKRAEGSLNH